MNNWKNNFSNHATKIQISTSINKSTYNLLRKHRINVSEVISRLLDKMANEFEARELARQAKSEGLVGADITEPECVDQIEGTTGSDLKSIENSEVVHETAEPVSPN